MHKFADSIISNNDKYKNELNEQNHMLMKQLIQQVSEISSSNANKDKHNERGKNLMNIFMKLKDAIKENCINTMNEINCSRIAIYLFHNGIRSTHGIDFIKISCICEKVAIGSGIRERMIEHTSLPINLFDEMVSEMTNGGHYIIMNNEETQNSNHKIFISSEKIQYALLVPFFDMNNNILGFISVEINRPYSKDEVDKHMEVLNMLVKQLVPVLSYSEYSLLKI